MTEPLTPEDEKLLTLARAAAARIGAEGAGAVRDDDGRSYVAASITLPSLTLTGLQVAVAQAAAAGAETLEAALYLGPDTDPGVAAVRDLSATAPIFAVTGTGARKLDA